MTDLGDLLSGTEAGIARLRAGSAPADGAVARTVRRVRRRRGVRHTRDAVVGVAAVGAVGTAAWWAGPPGQEATPAAPSVTASPTAGATPVAPVDPAPAHAAQAVHVAEPLGVPQAVLAAAEPGWVLSTSLQQRPGPVDTADDIRSAVHLVAPDGTRTTLLHVTGPVAVSVLDWRAGATTALAWADLEGTRTAGRLDLLTGDFTPLAGLLWGNLLVGSLDDDGSLWLSWGEAADVPPDAASVAARHVARLGTDETFTGTLRLVAADGTARDLGPVSTARWVPTLSPDGRRVAMASPAGEPQVVDVRSGAVQALADVADACTLAGWAGVDEIALSCPSGDGFALVARDVAGADVRTLATTQHPVRDAWPLGDGRVGVGIAERPAPCDADVQPAVVADGEVTAITGGWGAGDHGGPVTFAAGAAYTQLNACSLGETPGPVRDVRTDVATGDVVTFGWLDDAHAQDLAAPDGWSDTSVAFVVAR